MFDSVKYEQDKSHQSNGLRIPSFLRWTFPLLGMVAPVLVVLYAFGDTAEASERASIIIHGCEAIVAALVAAATIAGAYRLGLSVGRSSSVTAVA